MNTNATRPLPAEPLPVAVIGVGAAGAQTLRALGGCELVRVVGLADRDAARAERAARQAGVPAFGDNRSLLAETRPAAVFLATPTAAAADIVAACAERGIHVCKEPPLARNLAEGVAMVERMAAAGLKLAVNTSRRFAPGYRRAAELREELGKVFLARAHYLFNWGAELGWRGDRASAGGGALLELGYQPVDLLAWLLGCPEEAYGVSAVAGGPDGPTAAAGPHDTDDVAAGVLRYRRGPVAALVAARCSGPVSEALTLHGRNGSLAATDETCLLRDPDGNVLDHFQDTVEPLEPLRRQAASFARAVLDGRQRYECSGHENLLNLAVIDALYLSDRTAQAEGLLHLLKTHGLSVEDCLRARPLADQAAAQG
jgi:predicted dehydrogenase